MVPIKKKTKAKSAKRILVLGINHAGTSAIKLICKNFPNHKVVGYDQDNDISFLSCGIALLISGFVKKPQTLFYSSIEELRKLGAQIHSRHQVLQINAAQKKILVKNLDTGKTFTDYYDKLILGLGSSPIVPPLPGNHLKNIFLAKKFQHAKKIIEMLKESKIKKVAVIGAGYIGVEIAEALCLHKKEVLLFDMNKRIMSNYYDAVFTKGIETNMKTKGVEMHLESQITEFSGDAHGNVTTIKTMNNAYSVDAVIMAIGFRPNTEIVKDVVKLATDKWIIVNEYLQTSDPDIYAIGDSITIKNNFCSSKFCIALASNAIRTGIIAGINVATNNTKIFNGVQGSSAISVFDWKIAGTGLSKTVAKRLNIPYKTAFLETNDLPVFMETKKKVLIQILYHQKTREILGAQIASQENHSESIYFFSLAILKKVTIDELPMIDFFFLPHFNKPVNYIMECALQVGKLKIVYNDT